MEQRWRETQTDLVAAVCRDAPPSPALTRTIGAVLAQRTAEETAGLWRRLRRHNEATPAVWLAVLAILPDDPTDADAQTVAFLASAHRSGRVREAAVHWLARHADDHTLPALVLSCGDHFWTNAQTALAGVRQRLNAQHAAALRDCLALFTDLDRSTTRRRGELVADVLRLLTTPEHRHLLVKAVMGRAYRLRRSVMTLIDAFGLDLRLELLRHLLDCREGPVRLWAARRLLRVARLDELEPLALRLAANRSAAVRWHAITTLAYRLPHLAERPVCAAWFDRSPVVRSTARACARRLGLGDPAKAYRRAIAAADRPRLAAALVGLGECGIAADLAVVLPWSSDADPAVRAAAVAAAGRVDPDGAVDLGLVALADAHPQVSAAALSGVIQAAAVDRIGELLQLWVQREPEHVARNAEAVLASFSPAVALRGIVTARLGLAFSLREDHRLAAWLRQHWQRRQAPPPPGDRRALRQLHETAAKRLSPPLHALLDEVVAGLR